MTKVLTKIKTNLTFLDKSASVSLDNLPLLFEDLINDQALIGKSPNCTNEEVAISFLI